MSHRSKGRWILLAVATVTALGCASRDRWLDCESHLVPINAPAPVTRDEGADRQEGKSQLSSGHER